MRTAQGVNLGKLKDTHEIYKEVLHDVIDLDEAMQRLNDVINAKDQHNVWLCVLMYGLASAAVSVFFSARLIDMPVILALGCLLGMLQLVVAPLSKTYSTVFEISASILMSALARAFGSINGGNLFCFSAIAQSSIAMILPGWLVLSSALELQSRAIVPGSIRLVFAIIYSLFLGYGITVGTAIYGAIDSNATNAQTCTAPLNKYWNFLFVPLYVFFVTFTGTSLYSLTSSKNKTLPTGSISTARIPYQIQGSSDHHSSPSQIQANACHDPHRNRGIYCQLLRQLEIHILGAYCLHLRSFHRWCTCQHVQSSKTWRCCCGALACCIRSSPRQSCVQWRY